MANQDEWFDKLYIENSPRLMKLAIRLLRNQHIAEELVNQAFLILLYKRNDLIHHPNLNGWLSQTLKNLIADELKSAKHRLEFPLIEDVNILKADFGDIYEQPLSELLPKGLTSKEQEILVLYYEKQFSYEQIANKLNISILNCRTRLFRAKAHYKELIEKEKYFL